MPLLTLKFAAGELILLYIIVQVTALTGAFLMAKPIDTWGPKKVLLLSLFAWSFVSITAFFVESKMHFLDFGKCCGSSGSGRFRHPVVHSSPNLFPLRHESEYFGMYSLAGKSSAIMGPLLFGTVSSVFGSQRPAILAVSVFFIAGTDYCQECTGRRTEHKIPEIIS